MTINFYPSEETTQMSSRNNQTQKKKHVFATKNQKPRKQKRRENKLQNQRSDLSLARLLLRTLSRNVEKDLVFSSSAAEQEERYKLFFRMLLKNVNKHGFYKRREVKG